MVPGFHRTRGSTPGWIPSAFQAEGAAGLIGFDAVRPLRGRTFTNQPANVRSANRNGNAPANRNTNNGFRPPVPGILTPGWISSALRAERASPLSERAARSKSPTRAG
jgi:hypothetical protein